MLTATERQQRVEVIRHFPDELTATLRGLSPDALSAHAPDDPWTIQQIVHHLADSHMNSIIRLKLVLTTEYPTLVAYDQDRWVTLPDVKLNIQASLDILRGLHRRWCAIWDSLDAEGWARAGHHTENGRVTLEDMLVTYSDHCRDHLAQIKRILVATNRA
jgi:hypothetical protein